jgi:hypothetical protein
MKATILSKSNTEFVPSIDLLTSSKHKSCFLRHGQHGRQSQEIHRLSYFFHEELWIRWH